MYTLFLNKKTTTIPADEGPDYQVYRCGPEALAVEVTPANVTRLTGTAGGCDLIRYVTHSAEVAAIIMQDPDYLCDNEAELQMTHPRWCKDAWRVTLSTGDPDTPTRQVTYAEWEQLDKPARIAMTGPACVFAPGDTPRTIPPAEAQQIVARLTSEKETQCH